MSLTMANMPGVLVPVVITLSAAGVCRYNRASAAASWRMVRGWAAGVNFARQTRERHRVDAIFRDRRELLDSGPNQSDVMGESTVLCECPTEAGGGEAVKPPLPYCLLHSLPNLSSRVRDPAASWAAAEPGAAVYANLK